MKKYVFLFLLSFLLLSNKGSAQASLGISQYAYTIYNDTVSAFAIDSINLYVVNKGDSAFFDTYGILTAVQDSNSVTAYHTVDSVGAWFTLIPPGDSVNFTVNSNYVMGDSSTEYHYKINVIVIWPVAASASTEDSLIFTVFILLPTSINEIDLSHLIKAYPNPVINNITLENTGNNSIEEVRIYDTKGRLIEHLANPQFICTEGWAKGTYLINIQLENKQTHTIRVIKQ